MGVGAALGSRVRARAGARLAAVPELGRVARRPRLHANDARGDRQHDLALLPVQVMLAEQVAENRNVAESRNAAEIARVGILNQSGKNLRFPVLEAQQRVGVTRADLVGNRAGGRRDLLEDRAHLEADFDGDVGVQVNGRLYFQRETHVEILTAAGAPVGVTLLVMTGSRWPMRILAFTLLRARMRGLASVLTRPACFIAFTVTASELIWMVWEFWWDRSESSRPPAVPVPVVAFASDEGVSVALPGYWMPRSWTRLREISSTSSSSITSGSATSTEATSFSAMRTTSGVSRITRTFARSSMNRVFAASTLLSIPSTSLGVALVR